MINSAKYFGVIIDHKLNWIEHISYVKSKMSKGIGIMYKARQFLTKKALVMLYHAIIYPYMTAVLRFGVVLLKLNSIVYCCFKRKSQE